MTNFCGACGETFEGAGSDHLCLQNPIVEKIAAWVEAQAATLSGPERARSNAAAMLRFIAHDIRAGLWR